MKSLSELESRLLAAVYDLPEDIDPYSVVAERLGCTKEDVIEGLKKLVERGVIRRFGAILRHTKAGLKSNALFIAKVKNDELTSVAKPFVKSKNVTHCYQRSTNEAWRYNFYAMIHAGTKQELESVAGSLAKDARISDYKLLFSAKEFKKTGWRWRE